MADLHRAELAWSGFPGAPGVSVMYAPTIAITLASFRTLLLGQVALFPSTLTITFPTSGDVIDDVTGELTGTWTSTALSPVSGTGTGSYAPAAGIGIRWMTDTISRRRRVQGRTFLVPCVGATFTSTGAINPATVTSMNAALIAFLVADTGALVIWQRPVTDPDTGDVIHPGLSAPVNAANCIPKQVVLRSRRD